MYAGAVNSAIEQGFVADDAMTVIEEQAGEYFIVQVAQLCNQVVSCVVGATQAIGAFQCFADMPTTDLERSLK